MESQKIDFQTAIRLVQQKRCCTHISDAMFIQLREYEKIYQNRDLMAAELVSSMGVRSEKKRTLEMDDDTPFVDSFTRRAELDLKFQSENMDCDDEGDAAMS